VDADDAPGRLDGLVALADGGDLPALREAIGAADRGDVGELLQAAVLRLVSLQAAASLDVAGAGEPDESRGANVEELPVADPFVDPERPHSSTLEHARQLRMALLDQPDLQGVLNAVGALTADECAVIVIELAFDAWWARTHGDH
jgi:hypothetical protein